MQWALVSDVGGTNARFGVADLSSTTPKVDAPANYLCAEYPTFEAALFAYVRDRRPEPMPDCIAVAVAGPVMDGVAQMTNAAWTISEAALRSAGFRIAVVMNDFGAQALGAPCLSGDDLSRIGPAVSGRADRPIAILGAGTGFGVAALAPTRGGVMALLESEGGHVGFAPFDELEAQVWAILRRRFGRVSIERLLSGPGMVNLHQALCEIDGRKADLATAAEITIRARSGDPLAQAAVARFCAMLGCVAGDFALSYGAKGGVFIAGGIAPRLLAELQRSDFRARFEDKGRFGDYLAAIPTQVLLHPYAALIGAARRLQAEAEAA